MKTSSGDIITQYDLWRLEEVSLIKIDLLSIEALDRIRACLDLLTEYDYLDKNITYKPIFNKIRIGFSYIFIYYFLFFG